MFLLKIKLKGFNLKRLKLCFKRIAPEIYRHIRFFEHIALKNAFKNVARFNRAARFCVFRFKRAYYDAVAVLGLFDGINNYIALICAYKRIFAFKNALVSI